MGIELRRGDRLLLVISGGEHNTLRAASLFLYLGRRLRQDRQASMATMSVGVHRKQFVVHLGTLCQKLDIIRSACAEGENASPP